MWLHSTWRAYCHFISLCTNSPWAGSPTQEECVPPSRVQKCLYGAAICHVAQSLSPGSACRRRFNGCPVCLEQKDWRVCLLRHVKTFGPSSFFLLHFFSPHTCWTKFTARFLLVGMWIFTVARHYIWLTCLFMCFVEAAGSVLVVTK